MRIPILFYHKINSPSPHARIKGLYVSPRSFYWQMKYLQWRGYIPISLDDLLFWLEGGRALPPRPIVLTFDDGYKDNYTNAFPILKEFGFSATVFIVTRDVGKFPDWPESEEKLKEPLLSWNEIKEMSDYGISFQSHTHTHSILTRLSDEDIRYELMESKKVIEDALKKPVNFLCYPKGFFSERVKNLVKEAGYLGALTTKRGVITGDDDLFALKRIGIKHRHRLWKFIRYVEFKYREGSFDE